MHQKVALPMRLHVLPRFHCAVAGVYASEMLKTSQTAHYAYVLVTSGGVPRGLARVTDRDCSPLFAAEGLSLAKKSTFARLGPGGPTHSGLALESSGARGRRRSAV
jgi:hypothetical protein